MTIAAMILLSLMLGWWALIGGKGQAHLKLDAKSSVEAGALTLTLDGKEIYARKLEATGSSKGFLNKVLGKGHETFEAWIEVPAGKHELKARVVSESGSTEHTDTVVVDLDPGEEYRVRLVTGRSFGTPVSLKIH